MIASRLYAPLSTDRLCRRPACAGLFAKEREPARRPLEFQPAHWLTRHLVGREGSRGRPRNLVSAHRRQRLSDQEFQGRAKTSIARTFSGVAETPWRDLASRRRWRQ